MKDTANALLVASGSRYKRLNVSGESKYIGSGIHFCATCDGPFYKGEKIIVVGGGNSAAEESIFLLNFVEHVTMLVRSDKLSASQILVDKIAHLENRGRIDVKYQWEVESFQGKGGKMTGVLVKNNQTNETQTLKSPAAFLFIGLLPNVSFLKNSGVLTNEWGFIVTGHDLLHGEHNHFAVKPSPFETSVPGIFAAGDVRMGSTKQVASATGEGASAALVIREYLKTV
ncbi:MAG: FAD-dependent oxidoreductase [Anaerolineales bacterium]